MIIIIIKYDWTLTRFNLEAISSSLLNLVITIVWRANLSFEEEQQSEMKFKRNWYCSVFDNRE